MSSLPSTFSLFSHLISRIFLVFSSPISLKVHFFTMAILNDSRIVREPASPSHKTSPKAKQLLPHMVEELARLQPEKLYAEVPLSPTSLEEGYRKITYRNLANAVNGMAWFLKNTLGPAQGFPTLQYIGPNDSRHYVLALAAVKWGGKVCCFLDSALGV